MMIENCIKIENLSLILIKRISFEQVNILSNVTITIPKASIYGLIGPSGCGKTTLFRCLSGFYKPTQGSVKLFGRNLHDPELGIPGPNLGYAAQDNNLTDDLTITEMLCFVGRLAHMTSSEIKQQTLYVASLLQIDEPDKLIKQLSGGQQKRVSLAGAFLGKPSLLILDEPTVGLDPVLRHQIWNILKELVSQYGTTIIISTHYFEEVANADYLGIMDKGTIIKEGSPKDVKNEYAVATIEDALFKIFNQAKQNRTKGCIQLSTADNFQDYSAKEHSYFEQNPVLYRKFCTNFSTQLIALVYRMFCQKWATFYQPIILCIILNIITVSCTALLFGADPIDLSIGLMSEPEAGNLTSRFIDIIETRGVNVLRSNSFETSVNSVNHLETVGFCLIKSGFSKGITRLVSQRSFTDSSAEVISFYYGDETNFVNSYYVKKIIEKSYETLIKELANTFNVTSNISQFIRVTPLYGNFEVDKIWTGKSVIILSLSLSAYLGAGIAMSCHWSLHDAQNNYYERLKAANVPWFTVAISYIVTSGLVTIPISQISLLLIRLLFTFNGFTDSYLVWHLVVAIITWSGSLIGPILGIIVNGNFVFLGAFVAAYNISSISVSGILSSLKSLPYYADWAPNCFPVSSASNLLINYSIKNYALTDFLVASDLLFILAHLFLNMGLLLVFMRLIY